MSDWTAQSGAGVRFEWGPAGADRLVKEAACLVVVDVLSFTMSVSVAVERGIRVLPFWWPHRPAAAPEQAGIERAAAVNARQSGAQPGAQPGVHRTAVTPASPWSLCPYHLRAAPFVARLVLPSLNGAAICAEVPPGVRLVAACLRSVTAVGSWLTSHGYGGPGHPVAVIAAGIGGRRAACGLPWRTCSAPEHSSPTCVPRAEGRLGGSPAAKASYAGTADLTQ
jgi:2-phosphosulfolactate phosphatase